jgi:murein DD-endopeptidase MepM/ murein hydrolase activator NlpD
VGLTDEQFAALQAAITAAQNSGTKGGEGASQGFFGAVVDGAKSISDGVQKGIVKPTSEQLDTLPSYARKTGVDVVGPNGIGFIGTTTGKQTVAEAGTVLADVSTSAFRSGMGIGSGLNKFGEVAQNLIGPDGLAYMSDGEGGLVIVNGAAVQVGSSLYNSLVEELGIGGDNPKFKNVAQALIGANGLGFLAAEGLGTVTSTSFSVGKAMVASITAAFETDKPLNAVGQAADGAMSADNGPGGSIVAASAQEAGGTVGQAYIGGILGIISAAEATVSAAVKTMLAAANTKSKQDLGFFNDVRTSVEKGVGAAVESGGAQFASPIDRTIAGTRISQGFRPGPGNLEPNHTGIDIAAPAGTPIHAAGDGKVVKVGFQPHGYGNYCIIEHDGGWSTLYGHMIEKPVVNEGQRVTKGQIIGFVGTTGNSTGFHLHFETRHDGQLMDPSKLLPAGQGGGAEARTIAPLSPLLAGSIPGGVPGTTLPQNPDQAAAELIQGLVQTVKDSGGDFQTVLDAFFSGATELTADRLKNFSGFAQAQMKQAFDTLQLALQLVGGGDPLALRKALREAGVGGLPPIDPVSILLAMLKEAPNSGFADALKRQLVFGSDMTINQLAGINVASDAASRQLLAFIRDNFGGEISIKDLSKSVLEDGKLKDTKAIAPKTPDPAAEDAARQIRAFALANRFLTDESGKKIENNSITALLAAIKDSKAKTLEELLAQPNIANIGTDDSPIGQFVGLLRSLQAQNPNMTLADLQGFLFGGAGFQPTDIVDATNAVEDAINTQTAVLANILLGLDPTDPESIEIWKDLLHTFKAVKTDLGDAGDAAQQTAQATDDTATATQQTADNTTPPPPGTPGTPGGPPPPLDPGLESAIIGAISVNKTLQDVLVTDHKFGSVSVGVPEAGQKDFGQQIGQQDGATPNDPLGLVAKMSKSLTASKDAKEEAQKSIVDKIKEEIDLRQRLNDIMRQQLGLPPTAPAPPVGVPVGGGVPIPGGGKQVNNNTTIHNTVVTSNNAAFVAETVTNRQLWEARKDGG